MSAGRFLRLVTLAGLLMITACAPTPTTITISSGSTSGAKAGSTPPAVASGSEPGASEPSAGGGTGEASPTPDTQGGPSGVWVSYTNDVYKFGVSHPSDYQFQLQPTEKMAQLKPLPVAAWVFLSPEKVASDVADLEPPDLEIRVYDAGGTTSLENWLASVGLLPEGGGVSSQAFRTSNVSGLQLCASTMIFPGCSCFVLEKDRVYQLITTSQVGEEMVKTFTLIP